MKSIMFADRYYSSLHTERQVCDLVIPEGVTGDLGLVLCIHGGCWVEGRKIQYTRTIPDLCEEKGVAAACLNYRYVSEDVTFADQLDDISNALAAIKETGRENGINFNKLLLTGISAGGHLSLLYAYTRKEISPIEPVCVVSLCAPTDFENRFFFSPENLLVASEGLDNFRKIISNGIGFDIDLNDFDGAREALRKYSPLNYVDENTVPTIFGHGENDFAVPYRNSLDLEARLTEYGVEHEFVSFPHSGHACEDGESMKKMMRLFFEATEKYLK